MAESIDEIIQQDVPLSEMITTLRRELRVAQANAARETGDLELHVEEIEIELSVKVGQTKSGGASVWVVSGKGEQAAEALHKFRLKLHAQSRSGDPMKVGNQTGRLGPSKMG